MNSLWSSDLQQLIVAYKQSMSEITDEMREMASRPFQKGDMKSPLLEESSFAVLFPHYREKYLTTNWPQIEDRMKQLGINITLDAKDGVMAVSTTDETWDPIAILKARDMIKLLARSVPVEQAFRVLEDGVESMIIMIGRSIRNTERFVKRRQRLIGPNNSTLKALELLTNCYILVQGHTVAAIGSPEGLATVQQVAEDCMHNIHPVYHIKTLMVKRELKKKPELAQADWSALLPKFKKTTQKAPKKKIQKKKKSGGLPDYPKDSEIDRQMETGEYWLKKKTHEKKRHSNKVKKEEPKANAPIEEIKVVEHQADTSSHVDTDSLVDSIRSKTKKE